MGAIYCFAARTVDPQTNQPIKLSIGSIERFVFAFPGEKPQALDFIRANGYGSPGTRYQLFEYPVKGNIPEPMILCVQIYTGQPVSAQGNVLSRQHVQGGQPVGPPQGNGQQRVDGQVDVRSGFQELGDGSIPMDESAIYGGADHGTYNDIVQGPGGAQEQQRQ